MIKSMETEILTKMDVMEKKVESITNQRNMEESGRKGTYDLEESKSPDAKQYEAILQEASEEMESKMAEINGLIRNNE